MDRLAYAVKTPVFEGPLDLLLELIEKRKLFVGDVSLAQVTDDFITYVERQGEFPINESAEFIVVASTLMLIKSKSLLPSLLLTDDENASIEDLENRLKLYAKVKDLSQDLKQKFGKRMIFEKLQNKQRVVVFSPDHKTDIPNLDSVLNQLLESLPKKEIIPKALVRKVVSLEQTIERLTERISKGLKLKFTEIYSEEEKVSVIVGFLAVLELVKRGVLRVNQEVKHGEIELETESVTVPNYA